MSGSATIKTGWLVLLFCVCLSCFSAAAQAIAPHHPGRVLAQPKLGMQPDQLREFCSIHGSSASAVCPALGTLQLLRTPPSHSVADFLNTCGRSGLFTFVEPDYERHLASTLPNDPRFTNGTLWGLYNYGQSGGVPHADIDAIDGWDLQTDASSVIVAVLDSGIRYTHEDLAANMWTNPVDGSHGFNAFTGTNDASDDNGHGSLTAGVLGAVGNNGKGVTGVAWKVQMMSCKCFDSNNNGYDSTIIPCMDFARTNGAQIINASWGAFAGSQALSNAIVALHDAGILVVAAAGNNSANVDVQPYYPACYKLDNVISVAYTTRSDTLGSISNYGATNVLLAAPGDQIYSTFFLSDSYYLGPVYGTSLAAPYVSGALALLRARFPSDSYQLLVQRLFYGADAVPALSGKCANGRLNLRKALSSPIKLVSIPAPLLNQFAARVYAGPNRLVVMESSPDLANWSAVLTNSTSSSGSFDFVAALGGNSKFYRGRATP
jgi:subtilisin family serine protease